MQDKDSSIIFYSRKKDLMTDRKCLLLIDVGNTNIKFGLAEEKVLKAHYVLPTNLQETKDTFGFKIMNICAHYNLDPEQFEAWVVSSVVPYLDNIIRQAGNSYSGCPVYFVPGDMALPLENRYVNPEEVGADRLVTAYAARKLFSTPALMVIDFGTATTLECVQDNSYLGGLICPGVFSSLRALGVQTAKLPSIGLELISKELKIGDSTATSMNQGFIFAFASMIEGLCSRLESFLEGEKTIVATGGFAQSVQPVCHCLDQVCPDMLIKGLLMSYYG